MPWFVIPVNPEPWAIGSPSVGKKGGKFYPRISPNPQLVSFQEAVREALADAEPLPEGKYGLTFYFWRRLDSYETQSGRRHRKHWADATNMQKATEDALQGVLFGNDRDVMDVHSKIVHQGPEVDGLIIVNAWNWTLPDVSEIPQSVIVDATFAPEGKGVTNDSNVWPPPDRSW